MIGKKPAEHQMSIFEVALESFIDMNHELVLLSKQIAWEAVESKFAEYYCADNGRPSVRAHFSAWRYEKARISLPGQI